MMFRVRLSQSQPVVCVMAELVPEPVQLELKNLYNALCELLRHFWSCFPTNTPFLEEKVANWSLTSLRRD